MAARVRMCTSYASRPAPAPSTSTRPGAAPPSARRAISNDASFSSSPQHQSRWMFGVIGREALVRRQPRAQREIASRSSPRAARARAARAARAAARRGRASRARGSSSRARVAAAASRSRARRELLPFALEPLQREMQAAAPFAERRVRARRTARDRRRPCGKSTRQPAQRSPSPLRRERRVAARAGEQLAERRRSFIGVVMRSLGVIVAARASTNACTRHVM